MRFLLLWALVCLCSGGLWADEVVPPPPRLTPMPTFAAGDGKVDLTGTWRFCAAPPERFWEMDSASGEDWADIEVPGEWAMQGFSVARGATAGYARRVDVPAAWKGQRIKLRFDGVYSEADVYVNGYLAGSHAGGFTPFELDVTKWVRPGLMATLALGVRSETLADELASGSQYAAHSLGGITRKACLFAVPELNLASVHVQTTFDANGRDATLWVVTNTANEGSKAARGLELRVELTDPEGRSLPPTLVPLRDIQGGATLACSAGVFVQAPATWDAEHPRLYTLRCTLMRGRKDVETVQKRVGFRQVEVRGEQLFVNNRPVKLRGACRHETDPARGRSLTPELWRKDAELFRNANVNFVRTSHYPPAEEFVEACDELGIFLEVEAPLCWIGHAAGSSVLQEKADEATVRKLVVEQTLEMIQRDRSHPSVIIWSLANESKWGPMFELSLKAANKIDPTRPTTFHDQAWGQFNNFGSRALPISVYHYPGLQEADKKDVKNRPLLFGEYCHLNCYNRAELVTDPGVRDVWGRSLAVMWERMYAAEGCLGGALWAGIDDIFTLPSGSSTGYGPWGFIDGKRRQKPEYWHVKKVYSPLRISEEPLAVPAAGEPVAVRVANRHDFTNLGELRLDWQLIDDGTIVEWGTASDTDVGPRQEGTILVRPKTTGLEGKRLGLVFTSPRGFVVDSFLLPIGTVAQAVVEVPAGAPGALSETADSFALSGNGVVWRVDKKTGSVSRVESDGLSLALGGPTLMMLPLTADVCAPEYRADAPSLNGTCGNAQVESVAADGATVVVRMRYDEAEGDYRLAVDAAGRLRLSYRFAVTKEIRPRQVGVVLDLPRACDTLEWRRKAQWSVYPLDHIGRAVGRARAFPEAGGDRVWALDANALGSADFRSSKEDVIEATLRGGDGMGLRVVSDGHQTVRAFVDGERVRWLVAGYSTGGQGFEGRLDGSEDKVLKIGDVVEDVVVVEGIMNCE